MPDVVETEFKPDFPPLPPGFVRMPPEVCVLRLITQGGRAYEAIVPVAPGKTLVDMVLQVKTDLSGLEATEGNRGTIQIGTLSLRAHLVESVEARHHDFAV